jgi:rRNA-processing protein FCF1
LFKKDYKVILDDNLIFRATKEARDLVEGSEREQYGLLRDYANELMRSK